MARRQELRVVISGDSSSLARAFHSAGKSAGQFEGKIHGTVTRVGSAMRSLSTGAFGAAGLGIGALVKAGVDYEKQMARVKGVTSATGAQMQTLGDLAKKLGAETKFSAGEAAQAMYELGSAGFKVNDMAKVLPATLSLAAASGIELKDAAEIASNALNGFGISSDKMGHVADVLAQTVNRTSTEMGDLQLSLKYIGPIARLTGQNFETMLAAIGELGNAGIKGEQAGTTLRGGLIRLTRPTKMVISGFEDLHLKTKELYGPNGLKPLTQIIPILERAMKGVDKSTRNAALAQIFGTEAATGWAAIIQQGSDALIRNTSANRHSEGAAEKAAKTMNTTVAGAWENLTGSIETVGITLFEKFEKPLRSALLSAAGFVNTVSGLFSKIEGVKPPTLTMRRDQAGNTALRRDAQETASLIQKQQDTMFGRLGDAVATGIRGIDWKSIGNMMADGLQNAFATSGKIPGAVEKGMSSALSHVNGRKLLAGLLRVVSEAIGALFSPSFWTENFDNILATVTIVFPIGKILKLPGAEFLYKHISVPFFKAIKSVGQGVIKLFGKVGLEGVEGFIGGLVKTVPDAVGTVLGFSVKIERALRHLPDNLLNLGRRSGGGLVRGLSSVGKALGAVAGRLVGRALSKLASLVPDFVKNGARFAHELISGLVRGLKNLPTLLWNALKSGLSHLPLVGKLFSKTGEGIGKAAGGVSVGVGVAASGGGSGSLMGARDSLKPYAAIGSRFGLHVSSGRRPGSITSSGNVSYHSTGEAIDEAGTAPGMLGYFKYMKERFGGRLAELIYTPGGTGVKDGRPFRYTGAVAADHYDHVHVALDSGKPGVGDGLGKFTATSYGPPWGGIQGGGVTATGVNLKGSPHVYGIAVDPSVIPLGSQVHVQPNPFGYGGTFKAFDTGGAIKGHRIDFYDWRGRTSQNRWGSRSVSISTSGSSGGGGSKASLDARLKRNLDQLDTLRNRLANVPRGKAHAHERHALQTQIRSLVTSNRNIRGDMRGLPSATDVRAQQERAGSRLVNAVARPFAGAISKATRTARDLGVQIEDADTAYGQVERRQSQTDEDLGTKAGRVHRISEIAELRKLKVAQLGQERKRAAALKTAIAKAEKQLKALQKARRTARGVKRAKMNERIKAFSDRLVDLKAELKALGFAIKDTELDIGDLDKDARDVAATPDTEVEPGPTVTDQSSNLTDLIELKRRAGLIDDATAHQQKMAVLTAAIQGKFGATTEREQLQLMGDLRDAQQEGVQAMDDNTAALRDLQKSVDDNTAFARNVMATENATLLKNVADLISGQIAGYGITGRAFMPGSAGVRARY